MTDAEREARIKELENRSTDLKARSTELTEELKTADDGEKSAIRSSLAIVNDTVERTDENIEKLKNPPAPEKKSVFRV